MKKILYKKFLKLRAGKFTEAELNTQLQKRGHSLDKQIQRGDFNYSDYAYEVEILLKNALQKKFSDATLYQWADSLLFRLRHRLNDQEKVSKTREGDKNLLFNIIKERRSIRAWSKETVYERDIISCIESAKWAPSSCNRQLTRVVLLKETEDINFIADLFFKQPFIKKSPFVLLVLFEDRYGDDEKHFAYLDSAAFIQNLLLSLHSMNLGACWLGIKQHKDFDVKIDQIKERFNLKCRYVPVSIITIGKYDFQTIAPPRKNLDAIILNKEMKLEPDKK